MYTVSDFQNTYKDILRPIAGSGGLSNPIATTGFLDYELVPELKNKYYHTNLAKDQLVLTSFLYAKDNEYEILDAVKHLISKGCAALVIRNVFDLNISDMVIRYADAKNFPIFTMSSKEIFFEDIVYEIRNQHAILDSFTKQQTIIDRILNTDLSPNEIRESVYLLNPSFSEQFFCIYCSFKDSFFSESPLSYYKKIKNTDFDNPQTFMLVSNNGIFHMFSSDSVAEQDIFKYASDFVHIVVPEEDDVYTGISLLHTTLTDLKVALQESLYASLYCEITQNNIESYEDIESYKVIFPFANSDTMQTFCNELLEPIREFDTYYNYDFYDTLRTYINSGSNVKATAHATDLHEQTVRYRLNKIYSLLDIDSQSESAKEQLSFAIKIQNAKDLLSHHNLI